MSRTAKTESGATLRVKRQFDMRLAGSLVRAVTGPGGSMLQSEIVNALQTNGLNELFARGNGVQRSDFVRLVCYPTLRARWPPQDGPCPEPPTPVTNGQAATAGTTTHDLLPLWAEALSAAQHVVGLIDEAVMAAGGMVSLADCSEPVCSRLGSILLEQGAVPPCSILQSLGQEVAEVILTRPPRLAADRTLAETWLLQSGRS